MEILLIQNPRKLRLVLLFISGRKRRRTGMQKRNTKANVCTQHWTSDESFCTEIVIKCLVRIIKIHYPSMSLTGRNTSKVWRTIYEIYTHTSHQYSQTWNIFLNYILRGPKRWLLLITVNSYSDVYTRILLMYGLPYLWKSDFIFLQHRFELIDLSYNGRCAVLVSLLFRVSILITQTYFLVKTF